MGCVEQYAARPDSNFEVSELFGVVKAVYTTYGANVMKLTLQSRPLGLQGYRSDWRFRGISEVGVHGEDYMLEELIGQCVS